jgi:hypothetical protein
LRLLLCLLVLNYVFNYETENLQFTVMFLFLLKILYPYPVLVFL